MIAGSNPARYQLEFALWTRDLVRQVIAKRFGVSLSVGSVGRILRSLDLSPQRVACQNRGADLWPRVSARVRRFAGTR
jgi:transposase